MSCEKRCDFAERQATEATKQLSLEKDKSLSLQNSVAKYEKVLAESTWKYTVTEVKLQETEDKLHESEGKLLQSELKLQECTKQLDELRLRCSRAEAKASEASAALHASVKNSQAEILGFAETKVEMFTKLQESMFIELKKLISQEVENTKQLATTLDSKLDEFGAHLLQQESIVSDPRRSPPRTWLKKHLLGCQ